MQVKDFKRLLTLMKEIDLSRIEFLVEFSNYIYDKEGGKNGIEDWLIDVHQLSKEIEQISNKILDDKVKEEE